MKTLEETYKGIDIYSEGNVWTLLIGNNPFGEDMDGSVGYQNREDMLIKARRTIDLEITKGNYKYENT